MRVVDIIDSIQRMNGAFIPQHADIVQQRGAKMVCCRSSGSSSLCASVRAIKAVRCICRCSSGLMIWMTLVVSIRADFRAIRISVLRSRDLAGKNALAGDGSVDNLIAMRVVCC